MNVSSANVCDSVSSRWWCQSISGHDHAGDISAYTRDNNTTTHTAANRCMCLLYCFVDIIFLSSQRWHETHADFASIQKRYVRACVWVHIVFRASMQRFVCGWRHIIIFACCCSLRLPPLIQCSLFFALYFYLYGRLHKFAYALWFAHSSLKHTWNAHSNYTCVCVKLWSMRWGAHQHLFK